MASRRSRVTIHGIYQKDILLQTPHVHLKVAREALRFYYLGVV